VSEFISQPSWMGDIPDDAAVTTLSIPGTHNSCCVNGLLGVGKTQNLDLPDQLRSGIRFLDIRLAHHQDNLCVHHDVVCTEQSYTGVLTMCADFLTRYPSETILMSVKDEDRFDSALGTLAPSQVVCKLSTRDGTTCGENTRSFEETFTARTREHIRQTPLFYNFTPAPAGNDSAATSPAFTSETRLRQARGHIILLRRFDSTHDVGLDLTYWPENQRFRSATTPFYDIEDRYQNPGDDDKYNFVIAHIEDARRGDPQDLYITFSSAVDLTARGYAKTINPRLNDYLAGSPPGRVGIIVMDYCEEPQDLVSNVIKTNSATATTTRRPTPQP
jgi:1-phosphatidylinositol phosphodiesterase